MSDALAAELGFLAGFSLTAAAAWMMTRELRRDLRTAREWADVLKGMLAIRPYADRPRGVAIMKEHGEM